jgi:putative acetyltransferase
VSLDAAVRAGGSLAVAARDGLRGVERREHGDDAQHRGGLRLLEAAASTAADPCADLLTPATTLGHVDVRAEETSDWSAVRAVHLAAFGADRKVVGDLVDDLRGAVARGEGLSLVAEERDQVVGHVLFSPSLLDAPKRLVSVQVLSPIGVVPAFQKQGVGTALVRHGLELLIGRNVPLVFLEGPPAYYSRFGFRPAADLGFRKPSLRIPDAAFQVLRLPTYESWMTGTLVYHEAFWRHDAVGRRDPNA